jgi:hypothetical protein
LLKDAAMPATTGLRFEVDTHDLHRTRVVATPDATAVLPDGAVRLRIDHFALTSNNITYAAFGEAMKYWQFFPTGEPGWGCIPVWGFAEVVESKAEGVQVGERLYGYLPMASHLVVQPERVNDAGFMDATAHRRDLPAVYNHLLRCATDPLYHAQLEGAQAVLRPLFTTSFLIDDFLVDNQAFGAAQVVLSSASSKTAYGTAFCLRQRRATANGLPVIGLTSPRNLAFTESLDLYDRVLAYDQLESQDPQTPTLYIDMAGDAPLRRRIHAHWADRLVHSCSVGGTHWQELGSAAGLAGPRPVLFFAPAQVKRRSAPPPDGWGQEGLQLRIAQAWSAFVKRATQGEPPPLRLVPAHGPEALTQAYLRLLRGEADPREGCVMSL